MVRQAHQQTSKTSKPNLTGLVSGFMAVSFLNTRLFMQWYLMNETSKLLSGTEIHHSPFTIKNGSI
jgi:hypothetical protein